MRTTVPSTTSPCLRLFDLVVRIVEQLGHRHRLGLGGHRGLGGAGSAGSARRDRLSARVPARGSASASADRDPARRRLGSGSARPGLRLRLGGLRLGGHRLWLGLALRRLRPARRAGAFGGHLRRLIRGVRGLRRSREWGPRAAAQADSSRRSSPCTLLGCDVPAATTPSACGGRLIHHVGSEAAFMVDQTTRVLLRNGRWERRASARGYAVVCSRAAGAYHTVKRAQLCLNCPI